LAKGSTFSVTLKTGDLQGVPFLQPEGVAAATEGFESKEIRRWRFPRSRVLIVDDGAENRELLRLVLEDAGLTADEAENGQAGVEKATSGLYDVILMDVYMPVLDGFAAARKLRQQGVKTSIIALTANAMKGFEEECLAAGYSGYFSKPIDLDRFMEMMAELLGAKPVEKESEAAAASPAQPAQAEGQPVMSRLGSNPKFRKVILQFTEKLKRELARAQAAWEREDLKELALIAHWLKGAAGTVGFDPFTEPAAKLEHLAKTDQCEQAGEMLRRVKRLSEAIVPPTSAFDRKAA
jgi:CheY-like chemotaxis protein/HPt (histidine-containing phosphotransfer) domain-containing protein